MKSLFGNQIPDVPPKKTHGKYVSWKKENRYHKTKAGQKCGDCIYFTRAQHHNKAYLKCKLMGTSMSSATDVRVSSTCDNWKTINSRVARE